MAVQAGAETAWKRGLAVRAAAHLRGRALPSAFRAWREGVQRMQLSRDIVSRSLATLSSRSLGRAWRQWLAHTDRRRCKRMVGGCF